MLISFPTYLRTALMLMALLTCGVSIAVAKPAEDERPAENLTIRDDQPKKETFLDLIFGSNVQLPTERGILIIDAFDDLNKNGVQEQNEPALKNLVTCDVDKISYTVPAFIPGLDYNNRYKVHCSSDTYLLYSPPGDVFIERRGHVIEINLPCGKIND